MHHLGEWGSAGEPLCCFQPDGRALMGWRELNRAAASMTPMAPVLVEDNAGGMRRGARGAKVKGKRLQGT